MEVAKDWRGNVVPGNVYKLGNTDGIGAPSSPGIQAILDGLKAGNAKIVTAYPYTYGKNGYTATGYTDQQVEPYYMDWETGQHNGGSQMLFMNGKLYPFGTDWNIVPITQAKTTGYWQDEIGTQIPITEHIPTGKYRVRTRADNNVFDEFIFAADDSGNITGYNPKIYQTGSNSGGFFGSSPLGNLLNDMVDLAPIATAIFAPAYLPLVTGAKTAIQGGDIGDILKSAGTSYALGQIGQQAGVFGDQAATAAQYGTDLGSAQTAMLAAQEAGLGTVADVAGNVIGQVGTSVVSPTITGRDTNPLDVLLSSGVSAATPFVTSQIEGFSDLPIRAQNAINTIVASEMTGRDPTNAVIAEALRAGKDAYNNESRAIAGGWDSYSQLQDAAGLGIATKDDYLAYQQGPRDDETTAGIKEIVDQTQTGPRDDGTASDVQALIDQIPSAPGSGIQVAGTLPTDVFNVDVGGSPIYGDTSRANTVRPPFGYDLLPISMADQKPEGSYYDVTQNAWFMPTDEVQRLQDQLVEQTQTGPKDDGTTAGIQDIIDQSQSAPQDDGTTAGIQDIIDTLPIPVDNVVPNFPPPDSGSLGSESDLPPYQGGSLGDESDLPPYEGGSLGDESDLPPYEGGSLGDESDLPGAGTPGAGTPGAGTPGAGTPGAGTPGTGTPGTPITPSIPKPPTASTAQTGTSGIDLLSLLALMGGQQAAPTQPGVAEIDMEDVETLISDPLRTDYRKSSRQPTMAAGGSIDDLLALLNEKR